ncbi:MAG: ABC transporter substrate-binding protein [Conexivisphaerales archaeon]
MLVGIFNEVLGKEVNVPEAPKRIISLSPAITETLFMLGFDEEIVGVSAFCARPPKAREKRKVGSYSTVRRELIEGLRPDLILTITGYQRPLAFRLEGLPVYPLELPVSLPGILDLVARVGLVSGKAEQARNLSHRLARRLAKLKKISAKVRTYVEIDLGGPVSFGAYSYITDAISYLGAKSIYAGERAEWLKPDLEFVASQDPDAIIYEAKMYSRFDFSSLLNLIRSRGWDNLRAVKEGHLFLTPGPLDFLAHHGPSFITEAMPWLHKSLNLSLSLNLRI